jgi:hypothetical protein
VVGRGENSRVFELNATRAEKMLFEEAGAQERELGNESFHDFIRQRQTGGGGGRINDHRGPRYVKAFAAGAVIGYEGISS